MKTFFSKNWKKIAVLILVAVISFFVFFNKKGETTKTDTIKKGQLNEELTLSGEVKAVNYAKMSFETSGKIVYVGVSEGEEIKKGRLISKLDTTVLNSTYQSALASLRAAEATVDNIHDQVKDHTGDETFAQKDLRTTYEAAKDKAYEATISAKRALDGASLYAPFNGIVTNLAHPFTGVYTSLGATEVELIDPSTIYFSVLADQTEVIKLVVGQKVKVTLDSFEDQELTGEVENISFTPKVGESGSVYSVKIKFDNLDSVSSKVKIAMTGDAKFVVSQKDDVLYVPNIYVKQDKEGTYLKVDNKDNKIYINTGIESDEYTEVIGDLSEGHIIYD